MSDESGQSDPSDLSDESELSDDLDPSDESDPSDLSDALPPMAVLPEEPAGEEGPLLSLEEAVERIPAGLREQMEELLRADFREVQRYRERGD